MSFEKEAKPEKRETHRVEVSPPKKVNPTTIRELGKKAVEGASKDKSKK